MVYQNINILVEDNYAALSKRTAKIIKDMISAKPDAVLGLATGSTPLGTYEELARLHAAFQADFSKVRTFNLDEYYPIKKSSDQSYDYYMKKNFFDKVNMPAENTNIPNGEASDPAAECTAYEKKITDCGGIDLQLLGIGTNGHIGFNEPSETFTAQTFCVGLDSSTIEANARFFSSAAEVPRHAITVGMRAIMCAKNILLLASGIKKAEAVFQTIFGPVTPKKPASILQLHPSVTFVLDKEAASLLHHNRGGNAQQAQPGF